MELIFVILIFFLWRGKPRNESEEIEEGLLALLLLVALVVASGASLSCHERRGKTKLPSC